MQNDPYTGQPLKFARFDATGRSNPLHVSADKSWAKPLLVGVVMCFILVGMFAGAL